MLRWEEVQREGGYWRARTGDGTELLVWWDVSAPTNPGWAWRVHFATGREESGPASSFAEAQRLAEEFAGCR